MIMFSLLNTKSVGAADSFIASLMVVVGLLFALIGLGGWLSSMSRKPKKDDQSEPRES